MNWCRAVALVALAVPAFAPHAGAQAPMGAPGAGGGAPPCVGEFMPLRQEAEKRAAAIKAAADRKAPREEVCNAFKRFSESEAKLVKYMEANQSWCGIPPDAVKQMKQNHSRTLATRDRACAGGPIGGGPAPRPAGPSLSEALGTSRGINPNAVTPGRGTFDTLTGNALQR